MTTLVTALDGAYEHCANVIVGIDDAQLALPTPCAEWDVRATLDHLIGATWMFTLVNQGGAAGEDARGIAGGDPTTASPTRQGRMPRRGTRPARSTATARFRSVRSRPTRPR